MSAQGRNRAPIADRASTFGFTRWTKAAKAANLRPIYGVELAVVPRLGEKKPTADYWTFFAKERLRDLHDADPRDITLDHVVARCDGGSNYEGNLVTACRACNCSRQDRPLAAFAGPEARRMVRRNTARKLGRYLVMARALISGRTGDAASQS